MILHDMVADPFAGADTDLAALNALLDGCANPGVSRHALLLRLAALPPAIARPHCHRLVAQAIDPLLGLDRARLFRLPGGNLVLVWRGAAAAATAHATANIAGMFDGGAAIFDGGAGAIGHRIVAALELPRDTMVIRDAIAAATHTIAAAPAMPTRPLDPATLARLEAALAQADVAHFTHRKPVYRWTSAEFSIPGPVPADTAPPGRSPSTAPHAIAWEKRCLSVRDLAAALAPGIHPQSDPWLFRRLTRTLDRRMLALLCDPAELRDAGPFALDINVASILGPEFLRFDAALPPRLRGDVVLNLLPADILGDAGAFEFARDFVRARGYRILLRKLTTGWLTVLPPGLLGVDLIQLHATPDLIARDDLPAGLEPSCIVLSNVATGATLDWSRRQSITLLEGPMLR